MAQVKTTNNRFFSIAGFSLLFAYLLSFLFEGQVLYSMLTYNNVFGYPYILVAIIAHFAGLFSCGFFVKSQVVARYTMLGSMVICLMATVPFYFSPSLLWAVGLIVSGYAGGCAVASWGYSLKAFTSKNQRIKSCADVLIYSNIIMIAINVVAINFSPFIGLTLSMLCLAIGMVCIWVLPIEAGNDWREEIENYRRRDIKKPLILLCLFVFVITINSGLMYQVINPAFEHLTKLTSWYWAVPYIIALLFMRNLPMRVNRAKILYVGMAMIMGAFISFMLLERNASDYLVVNTLMLGACGIFDLFWWSIIGEMLEYTENPAKIFGIGLSANVFGVLSGGALGMTITSIQLPNANVAVIALTVVCVTLVMLPPLNRQLVMLLKNHTYLTAYDRMSEKQQTNIILSMKTLEELTVREKEVLQHILSGESNREIARALLISENTVKTHVRNIFSKYEVGSRAELISILFKNQILSS
ncbi:MAG: LuxR C-terminal-related transcriptional regulator [Bacillota bacterium]|jgi:DNA-binding CsgD family transcriptional regulator/MFS family permease